MEEIANASAANSGNVVDAPAPDVIAEVREYYEMIQVEYTRRLADIEQFLGFAVGSEALGTRLHKIEQFLGIKG